MEGLAGAVERASERAGPGWLALAVLLIRCTVVGRARASRDGNNCLACRVVAHEKIHDGKHEDKEFGF